MQSEAGLSDQQVKQVARPGSDRWFLANKEQRKLLTSDAADIWLLEKPIKKMNKMKSQVSLKELVCLVSSF
jgi:hypothetical protein